MPANNGSVSVADSAVAFIISQFVMMCPVRQFRCSPAAADRVSGAPAPLSLRLARHYNAGFSHIPRNTA